MAARVTRRWLWGAVGSIATHAVVFAVLLWTLRTPGPSPESEAVQVDLVRAPTPPVRPPPRPRPKRPDASVPFSRPPSSAPAAPPDSVPPRHGPSSPETDAAGAARSALRAALGCEHADFLGLSTEERQRCQDRMRRASPPFQVNLDPRGFYLVNPEPYLTRKPKNGCKVRVAGDPGPAGQSGGAAGVACGLSF